MILRTLHGRRVPEISGRCGTGCGRLDGGKRDAEVWRASALDSDVLRETGVAFVLGLYRMVSRGQEPLAGNGAGNAIHNEDAVLGEGVHLH